MTITRTFGACVFVGTCALMSAASCGNAPGETTDAAIDTFVSTPCNTNAECAVGTLCLYPIALGCVATKTCLPLATAGQCKAAAACTCDGHDTTVCGQGTTQPIAHLGHCDAGNACVDTCCSGTTCEICDTSGYAAPTQGSPRIVQNACTQGELQAFVVACIGSTATAQTCNAWQAKDGGACSACLAPVVQTDPTWGPFACATTTSPCDPNSGGCIDAVLGAVAQEKSQGGAGSCGDLTTYANACIDYACGTCTAMDVSTCEAAATTYECKTTVDAETSATGACAPITSDGGTNASVCFPQTDADDVAFVNVFCGTGP